METVNQAVTYVIAKKGRSEDVAYSISRLPYVFSSDMLLCPLNHCSGKYDVMVKMSGGMRDIEKVLKDIEKMPDVRKMLQPLVRDRYTSEKHG